MAIQFDPFSFVVATFALAIAVVQLYWNRPQHRAQVYSIAICLMQHLLTTLDVDGTGTLHVAWASMKRARDYRTTRLPGL